MSTTTALKAELKTLVDAIHSSRYGEWDKELSRIREIKVEIKRLERIELLESVNAEQRKKREQASILWECEQPESDITCKDMNFHSVKVKKYPKLAALQFARAKFEDGRISEISVGVGYSEYMFKMLGKDGTRPASFEAFLSLNSIEPADITQEEFESIIDTNDRINAEFQEALEKFDKAKNDLNLYHLQYLGLFESSSLGIKYQFEPKT